MNNTGPIHGQTCNNGTLHEINEHRVEPNFDHMSPYSHNNRPGVAMGPCKTTDQLREIMAQQLVWKRRHKAAKAGIFLHRGSEMVKAYLGMTVIQGIGL